jgi:hypothetical protein
MWVTENSVIYRAAKSMLMTDFSDQSMWMTEFSDRSMWMTEFSVTNIDRVCVTLGFFNSGSAEQNCNFHKQNSVSFHTSKSNF